MHSDLSERRKFSKIQIFNVALEKEPSTHSLHLSILGEGVDRKRTQAFKVVKMLVLLQYLLTTLILKPHLYLCFGGPVISDKEMFPQHVHQAQGKSILHLPNHPLSTAWAILQNLGTCFSLDLVWLSIVPLLDSTWVLKNTAQFRHLANIKWQGW